MNIYNEDNDSDNGSKERFNERLKISKNKKHNIDDMKEDKKSVLFFRNIFKIFLALPSVVYTNIVTKNNDIDKNIDDSTNDMVNISNDNEEYKGVNIGNNDVDNNNLDNSMYRKKCS